MKQSINYLFLFLFIKEIPFVSLNRERSYMLLYTVNEMVYSCRANAPSNILKKESIFF